jgi:hypothetical protein
MREFIAEVEGSALKRWENIPEGHPIAEWLGLPIRECVF